MFLTYLQTSASEFNFPVKDVMCVKYCHFIPSVNTVSCYLKLKSYVPKTVSSAFVHKDTFKLTFHFILATSHAIIPTSKFARRAVDNIRSPSTPQRRCLHAFYTGCALIKSLHFHSRHRQPSRNIYLHPVHVSLRDYNCRWKLKSLCYDLFSISKRNVEV